METFRNRFINKFSILLEPLGYRLLAIERPVYVRVVGGEIMHIVMCTYVDGKHLGNSQNAMFLIFGGVATVYKKNITEETFSGIASWMRGMSFFAQKNPDYFLEDESFFNSINEFVFLKDNIISLDDSLDYACELTEELILPELEKVQTLRNCINFFDKFRLFRYTPHKQEIHYNYRDNYDEENVYIRLRDMDFAQKQKELQKAVHSASDSYKILEKMYTAITDDEAYKAAMKEMERLKQQNIAVLEKMGLEFSEGSING